ncbi:MAG TPA: PLP-dependent aspartate aminotransferase family protein [Thermoanaerobaculia bacterium]|nr:PLP-dependent aspartate aminotransferase family protein [Thermoanaerobaculia bacterium]
MSDGNQRLGTRAVHAGERQPAPRRPAAVPVYQTAPFLFDSVEELSRAFGSGELAGLYSRYGNPTVRAVEEKLAALEGAEDAVAFASGMAALAGALAAVLRSGDLLIAARELYGGSHGLLGFIAERHPEVAISRPLLADLTAAVEEAPRAPRAVLIETPSNPGLACCDLAALAAACRARGTTLIVDNTFATPVLQTPLALGADIVVHSATKYLGGHSDVTAGLVAGGGELIARVRKAEMVGGGCLDPHAAFLVGRGMKTLVLRVERQSATATRLAEMLAAHAAVAAVRYPGLDPVGRRQMRSGGGMLAFELRGGAEAVPRVVDRLRLWQLIPSLGGVESGVGVPALTSHRQLAPAERAELGITDGLVRLSVGIEDADDLEADLVQALAGA